jgi:hypothetical protein
MTNKINRSTDYWFNVIWGGILTFLLMFLIGILIFAHFGLDFLNVYYFVFCLIIVGFFQWYDDNFQAFETGFSQSKNIELTKKVLKKLDWQIEEHSTLIRLTYNKFFLSFLDVTIIPKSEKIYFNFKYQSSVQTGRLPFYFGVCTFLKWKFLRSLQSELNKK